MEMKLESEAIKTESETESPKRETEEIQKILNDAQTEENGLVSTGRNNDEK